MTRNVAHLYLLANATILYLEIGRETDAMIAREMLGKGTEDTDLDPPEETEIREEAGEMIETEIDGQAEMSGISGIREMAEAVDGVEMVWMMREEVGEERIGVGEEIEIETADARAEIGHAKDQGLETAEIPEAGVRDGRGSRILGGMWGLRRVRS